MTTSSSSSSETASSIHAPHDPIHAANVARALLDIDALALRPEAPFTWSSGLVAPIYCDNRRTLAYPSVRRLLRDGFVDVVDAHDLLPATIVGTATAGIPHAAWLAEAVDQPMAYVRSATKEHGQGRRIEGDVDAGTPAVVVEDLVSTGGSALGAVAALREAGMEVRAVLSIFTYQLDGASTAFREADVPLHVLCNFETLVDVAHQQDALPDDALDGLHAWQADPSSWSVQRGGARMD